jgi:hypothetical protein
LTGAFPLKKAARSAVLWHIFLAVPSSARFDVLDIAFVERGEVGPSFPLRTKELIELGAESLRVLGFGSIDKQRHQPGCERCYCRLTKGLR